jgi:hypothetical protein
MFGVARLGVRLGQPNRTLQSWDWSGLVSQQSCAVPVLSHCAPRAQAAGSTCRQPQACAMSVQAWRAHCQTPRVQVAWVQVQVQVQVQAQVQVQMQTQVWAGNQCQQCHWAPCARSVWQGQGGYRGSGSERTPRPHLWCYAVHVACSSTCRSHVFGCCTKLKNCSPGQPRQAGGQVQ